MKPRILVFSPNIITTNAAFLQTRMFQDLIEEFDIYICCNIGIKGSDPSLLKDRGFKDIFGYEPSKRRQGIASWQLHINTLGGRKFSRNPSLIYEMNKKAYGNTRQRIVHRVLGASSFSARVMNNLFEKYVGENEAITKIIDTIKPDLMITFLCGSSVLEIEAIKSARLNGIPIVGLQYGWDSISTRGLMPFRPDYMGVWGYQSRTFAERMHEMPPERIFHVGVPFGDEFKKPCEKTESEIR